MKPAGSDTELAKIDVSGFRQLSMAKMTSRLFPLEDFCAHPRP